MTEDDDRHVSRRSVLQSVALSGAVGGTGATGRVSAAQTRPVFPEYVSDARGTYADLRGEPSITVEVGAGDTSFAFTPALVWVDPGTTVIFEWSSDNHNVVPQNQPDGENWRGTGVSLSDTGHTYSHTFETPGMYTYYCQPHDQLGMKGAVAVGSAVPTTEGGFEEDTTTVLGLGLPLTTLQMGVTAVTVGGAALLGTAGAWLWWHGDTVDVDEYADVDPAPDSNAGRADDNADDALATGDERAETARQVAADGAFRRAVAAWEDALEAYETALRRAGGGGRSREVRDRIETAETGLSTARERRDAAAALERRLRVAVDHRERAETAFVDGDYETARAELDRAAAELDQAAKLDDEHDLGAGRRVAGERDVVTSLRERCE